MRHFALLNVLLPLLGLITVAAVVHADISFEFNDDGVLPSAQGATYWPTPGQPYRLDEGSVYSVAGGYLRQNTMGTGATGGYLAAGCADHSQDIVVEWRMRLLDYGSSWGGGCSVAVLNSLVPYWHAWYLNITPAGIFDTFTGAGCVMNTMSALHTYRLEIPANQDGYSVFVDGQLAFSQAQASSVVVSYYHPFFTPGCVMWGDQSAAPAARVDWDYMRVCCLRPGPTDQTPPVTEAAVIPSPNEAGWNNTDVTVALTATDEGSDVAATYYTLDSGATQTYGSPFVVAEAGTHTVAYWSIDSAGNVEGARSLTIRIDTAPPTTQAIASPEPNEHGWHAGAVTVALSRSDGFSGVAMSWYAVDGGEPQGYSEPALLTDDGDHRLTFWSVDAAGNVEAARQISVRIDTAPPVTEAVLNPAPNAAGWAKEPVTVTLHAEDVCSGVAETLYTLDGVEHAYAGPIVVAEEGVHVVTFWSSDQAGNIGETKSVTIRIDTTPPVVSIASPSAGTHIVNEALTAAFSATDVLSGVASSTGPVPSGTALDVTAPGSYSFTVSAADNAGNTAVATVAYVVGYRVVALYDQEKAHKSGSTIPIKVRIEDATGTNVSSPAIVVTATQRYWVDGDAVGELEDSGNANPDLNFRYTDALYIFNLSTKGYQAGTWEMRLVVAGDPTVHAVRFKIRK